MNMARQPARLCPACAQAEMLEATREKHFRPQGKTVTVLLRVSRCPACGAELINAEQRRENLQRLRARQAEYGRLLLGEDILALRKKYGLTQQAAAKIFGKGKIAFSRYENETSYPDATMTKLMKLAIAKPEVLKLLADEAGVDVPLWAARQGDASKAHQTSSQWLVFHARLKGWLRADSTATALLARPADFKPSGAREAEVARETTAEP